jgi:hypothetical protein
MECYPHQLFPMSLFRNSILLSKSFQKKLIPKKGKTNCSKAREKKIIKNSSTKKSNPKSTKNHLFFDEKNNLPSESWLNFPVRKRSGDM